VRGGRLAAVLAVVAVAGAVAPLALAGGAVAQSGGSGVTVDADDGVVTVAAGERQVVNGTADASSGTRVTVRTRSVDGTEPRFIKSTTAVVRPDGTWSAVLDFSAQSAGDAFTLTARVDDAGTTVDGAVVACEGDCRDPAPDSTPTASPTPAATDAPAAGLARRTLTLNRGEADGLPLRFGDADALRVSIANPELGYRVNATVRDADGDGGSALVFDTATAGREGATLSAPAGDAVTITDEVDLDAPLPTGDYDVTVRHGDDPGSETVDVGTLFVAESNTVTASSPDEPSATPAATTAGGARGGSVGGVVAVIGASAAFLLGGAGLALLVLRR
jgi:hypothetical protein